MKKLLSVILVTIIMLSVSSIAVSAQCVPSNDYGCNAATVNGCEKEHSDYFYEIRLAVVEGIVEVSNARIMALVHRAQRQENPNIDLLVARTNAIAARTIFIADKLGIEVVCEYTPYEIDGQIVYIDPLIVIKR